MKAIDGVMIKGNWISKFEIEEMLEAISEKHKKEEK